MSNYDYARPCKQKRSLFKYKTSKHMTQVYTNSTQDVSALFKFMMLKIKPIAPAKLWLVTTAIILLICAFLILKLNLTSKNTEHSTKSIVNKPKDNDEKITIEPQPIATNNTQKSYIKTANTNIKKKLATVSTAWQNIKTQPGDTLAKVFKRLGLSQTTLQNLLSHNPYAKNLTALKLNQEIKVLIHQGSLEKLVFPLNALQTLHIERQNNRYVNKIEKQPTTMRQQYIAATISGSLYNTARRMNVPYKLVQQMTNIFSRDIDFAHDLRAGDRFNIIYQAFYINETLVSIGNIMAVNYTHKGATHTAIRHISRNGDEHYFTPEGMSLDKAFSRYPVKFSHISSTFSLSRQHPILHYTRPHKGIDLAAPLGTPIVATGDGKIEMIGRYNGFGNMIKVSHQPNYTSIYGHLLRFQKGLFKGSHIKRGQVIGYVGQSGLASGPHCHYEFHINHKPMNPTTVNLPLAASIDTKERNNFKINASNMLAQLKLHEASKLAINMRKSL